MVKFEVADRSDKLNELSDGYQSLIAICGDLIRHLLELWPSVEVAEALVLIDEIGLHMHPTWKMRIVSSLKVAFPRVQFVCSTHDPLCLRGINEGEVELVHRKGGNVTTRSNLSQIKGMRIDQILLSEHFGLSSTIDPDAEGIYHRYYQLLRQNKLTSSEKVELLELKNTIDRFTTLGETRRERLVLRVIDEFIASAEKELAEIDFDKSPHKRKALKILKN